MLVDQPFALLPFILDRVMFSLVAEILVIVSLMFYETPATGLTKRAVEAGDLADKLGSNPSSRRGSDAAATAAAAAAASALTVAVTSALGPNGLRPRHRHRDPRVFENEPEVQTRALLAAETKARSGRGPENDGRALWGWGSSFLVRLCSFLIDTASLAC
jgi:hypothetical protein